MILCMSQMIHRWWPFERLRLGLRWRRGCKQGPGIRVYIHKYALFAKQLRRLGVEHTLLRSSSADVGKNDFDILLNYKDIQMFLRVAALNAGKVPVDAYFDLRPSVETYHYFPPVLARKVIGSSIVDERGQTVPSVPMRFYSLLYHVLYHKGLNENLNNPLEDTVVLGPYFHRLKSLSAHPTIGYQGSFDFLSLHEYLDSLDWAMPRDLFCRWPNQHQLLRILNNLELQKLQRQNPNPRRIVFILREDADDAPMVSAIRGLLEEKLIICFCRQLTDSEKRRLITRTRGGNWYENDRGCFPLVGPSSIFACSPRGDVDAEDFCKNDLAPLKHYVREKINRRFPRKNGKRFVLHCGDDLWDSLECLSLIGETEI